MYELVRVGADQLIGEIIRLEGDNATIQVSLGAVLGGAGAARLQSTGIMCLCCALLPAGV